MENANIKKRGLLVIVFVGLLLAVAIFSLSVDTAVAPPGGATTVASAPATTAVRATTVPPTPAPPLVFDGASAMRFAQAQCDIGPRPPGSAKLTETGNYIIKNIPAGWKVEEQKFDFRGVPIRNIIARRGQGSVVIIGAHYDTRPRADNDPFQPNGQIIGGNDGASGVAVLLELARVLPAQLNKEVWLAFFDAEDSGGINDWPWSVGATRVAESLKVTPTAVVVLDMIGDNDQAIYYEANSDEEIQKAIFDEAAKLGYRANFIPEVRYSMTDDHTPFLERGYPAVDLIDFDYLPWHTMDDTCEKIGPASLERVGRTVHQWLMR